MKFEKSELRGGILIRSNRIATVLVRNLLLIRATKCRHRDGLTRRCGAPLKMQKALISMTIGLV